MTWKQRVHQYLDGAITEDELVTQLILMLSNEENAEQSGEIHLRLVGLDQTPGQAPTRLHIAIENGGTLTNLQGEGLWSGFISASSFEETLKLYNDAKYQSAFNEFHSSLAAHRSTD